MFESTFAAQGLDHQSRTLMAFYVAVLAHFGVVAAVAFASFWNVTMPKGPELPVTFVIMAPIPVADFWKPPATTSVPAPPKHGGSDSPRAIALPRPIVIPKSTPEETVTKAPESIDPTAPIGASEVSLGGRDGTEDGVTGGTGPGSGAAGGGDGPSGPVAITTAMTPPRLLSRVDPSYPTAPRIARIQGRVTIEAVIGLDGSVEAAQIVGSSSPLFDDAALDAVRQWRYSPASLSGGPVRVYLRVVVDFVLR